MMKENYDYIPSRELKHFFKQIEEQYGKVPEIFQKLAFIRAKKEST